MSDIVPPCDCAEQVDGRWTSQCYCSNRDDGERTAAWCVEANNADTITTLRATNERLVAELCWIKSKCDDVMAEDAGTPPEELTGYSRGAHFMARCIEEHARAALAEEKK